MSTSNENNLSATTPRTNLSSYIESDKYYCRTSNDKLDIDDKNNNSKDVNNEFELIITPEPTRRQEGVSKERNSSKLKISVAT